MKRLIESKTFWKAVITSTAGIVVAALTELDLVAYIAVVNAIVDVTLRMVTQDRIGSIL